MLPAHLEKKTVTLTPVVHNRNLYFSSLLYLLKINGETPVFQWLIIFNNCKGICTSVGNDIQ